MSDSVNARAFSGRAVVLFATQVFGAAIGIVNGILLARLLGPAGKGDYYLLILIPSTTMVLLQLGLPQAFLFYAARGRLAGLLRKAFALTFGLGLVVLIALVILMPWLRANLLRGLDVGLIVVAFLAFPLALNATYMSAIVMGRQAVRWYAAVNMAYPIATTVLLIVILGGLGPAVDRAIAIYLIATTIQSVGFAIGARRVTASVPSSEGVSVPELARYGLPLYPGTLTQYFSYRADAYLIAFLLADASTALGYYSMAVGLAEMVFFFPNAVATIFFPHVAGSAREDADRQVATVSRVAFLVTALVGVLLLPAAIVMIRLVLPAFEASIAPLVVLLPGVVSLSVTKILGGYVAGIGRPGTASFVNIAAFIVNIVANLLLIPRFGIVGASAASLLSYTLSSLGLSAIAARLTGSAISDFWIPRLSDLRLTVSTSLGLLRRARDSIRGVV